MKKLFIPLIALSFSLCCQAQKKEKLQVAFLADVHLQDLYGSFSDTDYKGILNPVNNKPVLMRTMASQLHSTRIFNENYFSFLAALDDIAKRGVKLVALPGDYSDDGQAIHIRGLQKILHEYSSKYGIQFFITTGNHDPVGPFEKEAGKDDFLGTGGKPQAIFSKEGMYKPKETTDLPVVITKDIATMGYEGITDLLNDFGFYPQENYKYWATPYSSYTYNDHNYNKALSEASYSSRKYEVASGYIVTDATYVTEPIDGLWLLALDGNVYLPVKSKTANGETITYRGVSVGYNNVLHNKAHLISWVKQIADEAAKRGKTLIAFSHYPMVDYNDGASADITALLGKGEWQMDRLPVEAVAQSFADAGIHIHFAGHMHINDTGIYNGANGNNLVNIQTPSLAAYIPAYKLLTIDDATHMEVETIVLNNVPRFNELFPLYQAEYDYLKSTGSKDIWNKEILQSNNYHDFIQFHLKELVRLRFIPNEWPERFIKEFENTSGYELLTNFTHKDNLNKTLKKAGLKADDYKLWNGSDMLFDLYRLQSADCLALPDIGEKRVKQYKLLTENFAGNDTELSRQIQLFYGILSKFMQGDPAGHFSINLSTGTVKAIKE